MGIALPSGYASGVRGPTLERKKLVVTGGTGLIGRHLVDTSRRRGWETTVLTRAASSELRDGVRKVQWDPDACALEDAGNHAEALEGLKAALEGVDAIVNLAGASLSEGRLGHEHRARVLRSRVNATRALGRALAACARRPSVWVQGSAVGYYGDTAEAPIDESAPAGETFLANVCETWEGEAKRAIDACPADPPRLVIARVGLVLAEDAPAWQKLLRPIRYGVGGALGSGKQWWPWVHVWDVVSAIFFLIEAAEADGAFNLSAPAPMRQLEMTRAIAKRLHRPSSLPAPAFALRAALGAVADELLLPSCKALPKRLLELGYPFEAPSLDDALDALL